MSRESIPISASIFADAIKELPLSAVYAKVSELRNSIVHLHRSNNELRSFITESCESEDDRREIETYVSENEGVVSSMEERIVLLKAEVENRGQLWIEVDNAAGTTTDGSHSTSAVNGTDIGDSTSQVVESSEHHASGASAAEGSRNTNGGSEEDGVHL